MITFATEFSVSPRSTRSDFLDAVRLWLLGSPHRKFTPDDLDALGSVESQLFERAGDRIEVECTQTPDHTLTGVRFQKTDDYIAWSTTLILASDSGTSRIGAQIAVEAKFPSVRVPPAKKPVFIKTLMDRLGGGHDGAVRVDGKPLFVGAENLQLVSDIVLGRSMCRMPVVYVSAPFKGTYLVDPVAVAERLCGMAHVLVEPDRKLSRALAEWTDGRNVYGGLVAIYWPNGGGRRLFSFSREYVLLTEIEDALTEEVRAALTNKRMARVLTWDNLREQASRRDIDNLKKSGSTELLKYIATFDVEVQAKEAQIESGEREIARLQDALQRAYLGENADPHVSLNLQGIAELYPGEIRDIVCETLGSAVEKVVEDSRRQHVLQAVSSANKSSGQLQEIRNHLKRILGTYNSMDAATRRGLTDLGFSIDEDGKHYKLTLRGDDRYTYSLAKSGSDQRGGKNAAADIGKRFF